ncbi:MAG: hypothetical protein CVV10_08130 [Gammaproteobacteria bacterium HGW-Gammaproteobacteria-14]|nr:MAG: hypothetical protein CVV10_08130 [Gammaproteobacteria bacterium HGW-Gammaproteobacteria-14]
MRQYRVCAVLLVGLSGCSWLPDRTMEYRMAKEIKPMTVPEGMSMRGQEDLFTVPDADQRLHFERRVRFQAPLPPGLGSDALEPEEEINAPAPAVENTRIVLTRDGNGFPIIMIYTVFPWAWEYVGQALASTDITIDDRSRETGTFFVTVPRRYGLSDRDALIKLSLTVNGVQVAVLNKRGTALVDREPGQQILQRLYDSL